jgi:hypothetical protein
MTGDFHILRLLDPGADIFNPFRQFTIQHGLIHQICRKSPNSKGNALVDNRPVQIPVHAPSLGYIAPGLAVGAKNTIRITSRYGLDLNMIGSGCG